MLGTVVHLLNIASVSLGEVDHLLDPHQIVRAQAGPRVRVAPDERVDGIDLAARDRQGLGTLLTLTWC